jgi:excisionase family DNA binding protein
LAQAEASSVNQTGAKITMSQSDRRTLTVDEAAPILGISATTLYRTIERGECPIPVLRIGARVLIPKDALDLVLRDAQPQKHRIAGDEAK